MKSTRGSRAVFLTVLPIALALCLVPAAARADCGHDHGGQKGATSGACPMEVPGTTVSVAETDGGVALVFTTGEGDVSELRRRVQAMAEMHNAHHAGGRGDEAAGHSKGMPIPSEAAVEDVEGGARIVLTPQEPAQLAALRDHVRDHAQRITAGDCPMKGMHGQAGHAGSGAHRP